MKRPIKAIAGILLGAFLVLAGCTDILNPPERTVPDQAGNVVIQISHGEPGTARTLMPDFSTLTYELTFAGPTGESHGTETVTLNTPTTITLAEGAWTITATGKIGTTPAAQGSWTGTVGSPTIPVSITLAPITNGNGILSYRATFPSGVTSSTLNLTLNGTNAAGTPVTNLISGQEATINNLPAGAYLLNIRLSDGAVTVSRTESAHIYPGLTTRAEYAITGAEFIPPADPSAPTVSAGNAQLSVTWTTVSGATAYEVWYGTASNGIGRTQFGGDVTSGTSATITGLTNDTAYYVWVKAKNSAGTSGFSASASGTPVLPTLPTPAAPTVSPGNAQLSVTWTTVSGATAYEVWYGTASNGTGRTQFGGDVTSGTSATITGLTNGTAYYVWVKAKGSAGTISNFSPSASGTPVPPIPSAPTGPTVYAADSQLTVSWTTVSGATAYEVWYGTASNGTGRTQFGGDVTSGTSATITGLTNSTTYYVWMKAKNSTGTSGFSPSASGTPAAATAVPGTPDTPIVTRGDGTLIVTWTPVSGATAYEVRYGTGSATTLVGEFTGTSAVITGLANGTLYRVRIRARNSEGYSGYSGNAVAVIAPAVPRVTLGNTQLGVTWTAVTQAAAYEVWFGTADNSTSAQRFSGDFTGTSADITGLTNGTTYYVWVKAKSSSNGTSGFSPSASGTPQWPDVTLGYADGNIILTDRTGAVISAITLSKAGSPQTITLNAGDAFTGVGWYIDGAGTGTVSSKITLNASAYSVNKHYVTFTGWRNGAYVSSAIPFTVTN